MFLASTLLAFSSFHPVPPVFLVAKHLIHSRQRGKCVLLFLPILAETNWCTRAERTCWGFCGLLFIPDHLSCFKLLIGEGNHSVNRYFIESQNGLGWKGLQDDFVPAPCHKQEHLPLAQVALSLIQPHLGPSQGYPQLCQGLTTLSIKNVSLTFTLTCHSFSLKPSPLVLSHQALLKNLCL